MKGSIKLISFFMTLILILSCIPFSAIAQTIDVEDENAASAQQYEDMSEVEYPSREGVEVLSEDVSLRDEFEKHYICSDGSYVAVTYDEAVHYLNDEGEWVDIDNSLALNTVDSTYEAQNGDFKVSFYNGASSASAQATILQNNRLISLRKGDNTLSWSLCAGVELSGGLSMTATAQSASASLSVAETVSVSVLGSMQGQQQESVSRVTLDDDTAFDLPDLKNQVRYDSLFGADEGVSVRYTAYRNKIEEDIFIERKTDITSFSMLVECDGLTPVLNVDNSVDFIDNNGEMVYHISIPYMSDSAHSVLNDIEVTLVKKGDMCIITYTPDSEWLSSEDRVYPIMLDPSITTADYSSNVKDTYVVENSTTDHSDEQYLYINYSNGKRVALISFTELPYIHESMPIFSAKLSLNLQFAQFSSTSVYAEIFSSDKTADELTYAEYIAAERSSLATATMLASSSSFSFTVTPDIYNIYDNYDSTVIAIKLDDSNTSFYYPICSSEGAEGYGPALVISYGYTLPESLGDGAIISLQNVHNSEYLSVMIDNALGEMGTDELADCDAYNDFELVYNQTTGACMLRATYDSVTDRYVTANGDTLVISSVLDPAMQEWFFVGADNNSFRLVLASDMTKYLSITSHGYLDYINITWVEEYSVLGLNEKAPVNTIYTICNEERQSWRIYNGTDQVVSNNVDGIIETGVYYINNVLSGGFLKRTGAGAARTVTDITDNIKWIVTNIGENEYTLQPYHVPNLYMRGTSSGIRFVSASSISENITWIIEQSPTDRRLLTIRNKDTGKYLYIETDSLKVDDTASTYISHRWRFVQPDDYTPVTADNVSFDDINMSIQSTHPIVIHRDFGVDLAIPEYDFEFSIVSDENNCFEIRINEIICLDFGSAVIKAEHLLTGTEFFLEVNTFRCGEELYYDATKHIYNLDNNGFYQCCVCKYRIKSPVLQDKEILSIEDYLKVVSLLQARAIFLAVDNDSTLYISPDGLSHQIDEIRSIYSGMYDYSDGEGDCIPMYSGEYPIIGSDYLLVNVSASVISINKFNLLIHNGFLEGLVSLVAGLFIPTMYQNAFMILSSSSLSSLYSFLATDLGFAELSVLIDCLDVVSSIEYEMEVGDYLVKIREGMGFGTELKFLYSSSCELKSYAIQSYNDIPIIVASSQEEMQ